MFLRVLAANFRQVGRDQAGFAGQSGPLQTASLSATAPSSLSDLIEGGRVFLSDGLGLGA